MHSGTASAAHMTVSGANREVMDMHTHRRAGEPEIPPGVPPEAPPEKVPPGLPPDRPVEIPEPPQEIPPAAPPELPVNPNG